MDTEPELIDVPVVGGTLRVARWGTARNVAIAAHGITGSSMGWLAVARRLDDDWSIVAPDLRGRGESRDVPGPFGLEAHADDLIAIAGHLGVGRAVLAGHSMGAFVVAIAAAKAPALGERVVLVDGGLPLPLPGEGLDLDAVIEAILGPALARLRMTFDSPDDYLDFWRQHPAFSEWTDDVEAYFRYDLTGKPGSMRSKAAEAAVMADGRDLLLGEPTVGAALRAIKCPVTMVRAPRGLLDEPGGFQPDALVDTWRPEVDDFRDELVDDTNHYTIQFGDRGATVVAARIAGR